MFPKAGVGLFDTMRSKFRGLYLQDKVGIGGNPYLAIDNCGISPIMQRIAGSLGR
jgi:hypothetical protein